MRKVIFIFIFFVVLIGNCYAVGFDETPYLGTWVNKEEGSAPDFTIEILHIAADHQAYYIRQAFNNGSASYGVTRAGVWEAKETGADVIFDKNEFSNYSLLYEVPGIVTVINMGSGEKEYFTADAADLLSKMADEKLEATPSPSPEPAEKRDLPDGLRVPMGEYLVGEYIPAGNYRVTLTGEDLAVVWVYKKGAIMGQYYSLVYKTGETVANIRLAEGDTFKVEHATVILSEMTGL